MTVKITASITNEITAEYDVGSKDEAMRMFLFLHPDADIKEVRVEPVDILVGLT